MNKMFFFPGLLLNHLDETTADKMNVTDSPYSVVFMNLHLGRPVDTDHLQGNANVILSVPEDHITKVTLDELIELGLIYYEPNTLY